MTRKDPNARKTPSTTKRMILMLVGVAVIIGGVFAVKYIMGKGMNDFFVFAATAAVSFLAGSILHSSGWQAVNWMIFPALALILVPLLWQGRYGCN